MHRTHLVTALLVTSLSPSFAQSPADPVELRLPASGGAADFVLRSRMHQDIDAGGQQMTGDQDITQEFSVTITAAADNTCEVELVYRRIRGSYDAPQMEAFAFDTAEGAKDTDAEVDAGVRELIGKKVTARVTADGKFDGIAGLTAAAAALKTKVGDRAQMLELLSSDNGIITLLRSVFGPRPDQPVAVAASWDREETTGSSIRMLRKLRCTLTKASADAAEIAVDGTVVASKGKEQDANAQVEDGKFVAAFAIDRRDGFAHHGTTKTTLTVLLGGGMATLDLTVDTEVTRAVPAAAPTEAPK